MEYAWTSGARKVNASRLGEYSYSEDGSDGRDGRLSSLPLTSPQHDRHTLPVAPRSTSARLDQQPGRPTGQRISSNVRSINVWPAGVRSRRLSIWDERTWKKQGRKGPWSAESQWRVQVTASSAATRLRADVSASTVPHVAVSERAARAASRDGERFNGRRTLGDEHEPSQQRSRGSVRRTGLRHEWSRVAGNVADDDWIATWCSINARWTVSSSCTRDRDLSV